MNTVFAVLLAFQVVVMVVWAMLLRWQIELRDEMNANHERWEREDRERLAEFKRLVVTASGEADSDV